MMVDLMVLTRDEPRFGEGVLVSFDENALVTRVQNGLAVGVGTKIHAKIGHEDFWMRGKVSKRVDDVAVIQIDVKFRRDARVYPRQHGAISLSFSDAGGQKAINAWVRAEESVDKSWHQPDEFMNFSASGLKFNSPVKLRDGAMLKLALRVPTAASGKTWHVAGEVIRCASGEGNFSVSLKFIHLPDECCKELVEFTERLLLAD